MTFAHIKSSVRALLPQAAIARIRGLKRQLRQRRDRARSAADVFGEIYRNNLWGGERGEFFSGEGTHHADSTAYVELVASLVRQHGLTRVIDIGCGDFRIGRDIAARIGADGASYLGIDVVPDLIERNRRLFAAPRVDFACLDATRADLPAGDLVLVREVLQHLSNAQIAVILGKLKRFPFALITEYQPAPANLTRPNIDKAHGMDTRIWDGSAVFPEHAPFSLVGLEVVLRTPVAEHLVAPGERVVSYLMRGTAENSAA